MYARESFLSCHNGWNLCKLRYWKTFVESVRYNQDGSQQASSPAPPPPRDSALERDNHQHRNAGRIAEIFDSFITRSIPVNYHAHVDLQLYPYLHRQLQIV